MSLLNDRTSLYALIVDDNPDDRVLVKRELQREFPEVRVEEVSHLTALHQALSHGHFNVVVTDYDLKWSNGLFVARAIKARYPDYPIIMFTNSGDEEVAVTALKEGVDDYVLKRKGYKSLAQTVKKVMSWSDTKAGRTPRCMVICESEEQRVQLSELVRRARQGSYIASYRTQEDAQPSLLRAGSDAYDAVIISLPHPEHTLLREVADRFPMLPIIILGGDQDLQSYYESGAWAVLPKPMNQDVFLAWLRRAIRITALDRRVRRQNTALERYARALEQAVHPDGRQA
jgi:DNA-binding NtrC family response regulator